MEVDPVALAILMAYGFDKNPSTKALLASNNSIDDALDWLSEHMDEV
jgi:uncharacterized UBP type Zn finger protein